MSFAASSISVTCLVFSLCLFSKSSIVADSMSEASMNPLLRASSNIVQVFQTLSPYIFARSERAFSAALPTR